MRKLRNSTLIILVFIGAVNSLQAQKKGFLGKTNEISIDVFSMLYAGTYGLHYKKVLGKSISIDMYYARVKKSGEAYDQYKFFVLTDKSSGPLGNYKMSGVNWGVDFLISNAGLTGMEAPFGNYLGIGFDYLGTNYTLIPEKVDHYSNISNQSIVDTSEIISKKCRFGFVMGRDSYITNNIVFDINVHVGFQVRSTNRKDGMRSYGEDDLILPRRGEFFGSNFFVYPNIKIGYIF